MKFICGEGPSSIVSFEVYCGQALCGAGHTTTNFGWVWKFGSEIMAVFICFVRFELENMEKILAGYYGGYLKRRKSE